MTESFAPIAAEQSAMLRAQTRLLAICLDDFSGVIRGFTDDATHNRLIEGMFITLKAAVFGEDQQWLAVGQDE